MRKVGNSFIALAVGGEGMVGQERSWIVLIGSDHQTDQIAGEKVYCRSGGLENSDESCVIKPKQKQCRN
jgi:hypothetical protein